MAQSKNVALEIALHWRSPIAQHVDRQFFERVDFWRDLFPGELGARLEHAEIGEPVRLAFGPGELTASYERDQVRRVGMPHFQSRLADGSIVVPRIGRFYPRNLFKDHPDFCPGDRRPFRCLGVDPTYLCGDFNHPFAGLRATIEAVITDRMAPKEERGGRCADLAEEITHDGPGMQAALPDHDTDFYSGDPFARLDARPDTQFYLEPRLVQHLDGNCRARLEQRYARFLEPGMRVLDLMSSWVSHVPDDIHDLMVTGVGLNRRELDANKLLLERVVHDLNATPALPFKDASFDCALCTVSVEYLTQPVEVFKEVARVLRPGAPFIVTFSDRWFPTKVVQCWTELHPFERLGLVADYFRLSGAFTQVTTETLRGLPRPPDDQYADRLVHSDPLFAVWGMRAGIG